MDDAPPRALMSLAGIEAFLARDFPQVNRDGTDYLVEAVGPMAARMRLVWHERHLRPGGTISGPAMFTLADLALYIAILANIGPVGLAVTTSLTINFLSKPAKGDLIGECRLMKLGKRLAVGEVLIRGEADGGLAAHAVGTYSIPPR